MFTKFFNELPHFIGILDLVDEATAQRIVEMMPQAIASPDWYNKVFQKGSESIDNLFELHQTLCNRYPLLGEQHTIQIDDGFCRAVTVAEFEGQFTPDNSYRLMVATISYDGTVGEDVYLAINMPYLCRTVLLVSEEISFESGPGVVGYVYRAYAEALSDETGEWIDIDDILEELEEEI